MKLFLVLMVVSFFGMAWKSDKDVVQFACIGGATLAAIVLITLMVTGENP